MICVDGSKGRFQSPLRPGSVSTRSDRPSCRNFIVPWSFEKDHGRYEYVPTEEWLTNPDNVPSWEEYIPKKLGLDEPGYDRGIADFCKFVSTPIGALVWHMFCQATYTKEFRTDIHRVNKETIVDAVNRQESPIFILSDIQQLIKSSKLQGQVLLQAKYATFMARMFNYYHCVAEHRQTLFNLRPRFEGRIKATCPACLTQFYTSGHVEDGDGPRAAAAPGEWRHHGGGFARQFSDTRI